MANDPLENSKISGNFSEPKSPPRMKDFPEPFSPPAYVALALELACQAGPYLYGESISTAKILTTADKFVEFLEHAGRANVSRRP